MKKLFLDDERQCPSGWEPVKTAEDMIYLLRTLQNVSEVSFDHDLGDGLKTGMDVINWMDEWMFFHRDWNPPTVNIHSANPKGVENMKRALLRMEERYGKKIFGRVWSTT